MRRMSRIVGRSDDMLIIRGVNLFPSQIEELVLQQPGLAAQYQLVVSRDGHLDDLEVRCELQPDEATTGANDKAAQLQQLIKAMTGVSASVVVGAADSIERTLVGKARRVIDKRPRD